MHESFINARELIEDAETLLAKRPGRSISLAVLAIEEIGKVVLLANAAARGGRVPIEWETVQKKLGLRSHSRKQSVFAFYGQAFLNRLASELGKPAPYREEFPVAILSILDLLKQLGFYVDVIGGRFIGPGEFGSENRGLAEGLIGVAKERIGSFERMHGTPERSLRVARAAADFAAVVAESSDEDALQQGISEFLHRHSENADTE